MSVPPSRETSAPEPAEASRRQERGTRSQENFEAVYGEGATPRRRRRKDYAKSKRKPPTKKSHLPKTFKAGFMKSLDGRRRVTQHLKAKRRAIFEDLGGIQNVSNVRESLIERFVFLEATLQTIETAIVAGDMTIEDGITKWTSCANSMTRLAASIGLDRLEASAVDSLYTVDAEPVSDDGEGEQ